ncbi:MAG TPA: Gfo/Idh/MocA family oxidoreductase [Candidatus Binataceae bacterium]|nr:Gfo/Idh/MocA family oxidoreductase [Candidatus Binataceae bacterium]
MAAPVKRQIQIGLIGAGLIGQAHSMMLRLIAERTESSVRIDSIYDVAHVAAEKLVAKWPGAKVAASVRKVLDDPAIDAVFICTPTASHREICVDAARAGKHIFCEKPLAMSAAEAAEMQVTIESAGVISQVGLVMRFMAVYHVMRALANDFAAGQILAVAMRDDQDFPIRGAHPSGWRNDRSLTAGGTLVEHSVHDVDLFTWMFGPIARLYCTTRNVNGAPGVEDVAFTQFEFAAGFHGQLASIWHRVAQRPSNRRLEIFCENLMLASDDDAGESIYLQRGDGASERIERAEMMARFEDIILNERPYLAPLRDIIRLPYALEDAAFLAALRGDTKPDPPFGAGVAAQRIVELAYESARLRMPIDFKP